MVKLHRLHQCEYGWEIHLRSIHSKAHRGLFKEVRGEGWVNLEVFRYHNSRVRVVNQDGTVVPPVVKTRNRKNKLSSFPCLI